MLKHRPPLLCLLLAFFLGWGCGGSSASQRTQAIRDTYTLVSASADGFATWDGEHQTQLVDQAQSLEQGKAALEDYRGKRQAVLSGLALAYRAIAAAAAVSNDQQSVDAMLAQATNLIKLIDSIRKGTAIP